MTEMTLLLSTRTGYLVKIAVLTLVNAFFVLGGGVLMLTSLKSGFDYCAVIDIPNPPGCDPLAIDAQNRMTAIVALIVASGFLTTYIFALKEKRWALYTNLVLIVLSVGIYFGLLLT